MHFGEQCVLAAVGVDVEGRKHVLALREGATENAAAAKDLLRHLVEHGVDPARRRLFIIDGSKALRTAINAVFGAEPPVQKCRERPLPGNPMSPRHGEVTCHVAADPTLASVPSLECQQSSENVSFSEPRSLGGDIIRAAGASHSLIISQFVQWATVAGIVRRDLPGRNIVSETYELSSPLAEVWVVGQFNSN